MHKKLVSLSVVLLVSVLCATALAAFPSSANPLLIDLNGNNYNPSGTGNPPDANTQAGWYSWNFPFTLGTSPYTLNKQVTHNTTVILNTYRFDGSKSCGARRRYQADGTCLSNLYQDFFYVSHSGGTSAGLGVNYLELDFVFANMVPNSTNNFTFSLFTWDPAFGYWDDIFIGLVEGDDEPWPPLGSKRVAWSLANPAEWLADNGFSAGYQPGNIPAGLDAEVLARAPVMGPRAELLGDPYAYASTFSLDLTANAAGVAVAEIFGWNDNLTWQGSQHLPINGIRVVPEPATVALLGLGGLALLHRRKRIV
jgi:hypothetical protein